MTKPLALGLCLLAAGLAWYLLGPSCARPGDVETTDAGNEPREQPRPILAPEAQATRPTHLREKPESGRGVTTGTIARKVPVKQAAAYPDPARPKGAWEPPVDMRVHGRPQGNAQVDAAMTKAGHRIQEALPGVRKRPLGMDRASPDDSAELRRWMPELSPEDDHDFRPPDARRPAPDERPVVPPTVEEKRASLLEITVHVTSPGVRGVDITVNGRSVGKTPVEYALVLPRPADLRIVGTKPGHAREVHQIRLPTRHPGGPILVEMTMPEDIPLKAGEMEARREDSHEPTIDEPVPQSHLPTDTTNGR